MKIERYSHVMHLVSDIGGIVREGIDAFDALKAAFPAGTLSGAPKIRAMKTANFIWIFTKKLPFSLPYAMSLTPTVLPYGLK